MANKKNPSRQPFIASHRIYIPKYIYEYLKAQPTSICFQIIARFNDLKPELQPSAEPDNQLNLNL